MWKLSSGDDLQAPTANYEIEPELGQLGAAGVLFLGLRAFASGCTALTGVEAISNGVPAFRKPKSKNAASTLGIMGILAITMFSGVTFLAIKLGVKVAENPADLIGLPGGPAPGHGHRADRLPRSSAATTTCPSTSSS